MKKQNASNKMTFTKVAIAELNDSYLKSIAGGFTTMPPTSYDFTVILDRTRATTSSIAR